MFYFIRENIKIIIGAIVLFHLLFLNSKGMGMKNSIKNNVSLSIANPSNLLTTNYHQQKKIKKNDSVNTAFTRRKYCLNKKSDSLFVFNEVIRMFFTSCFFVRDYKKHLLESSVSLSLLRGPPIV